MSLPSWEDHELEETIAKIFKDKDMDEYDPLLADKGEQCIYCGKDSWTCEHFKP